MMCLLLSAEQQTCHLEMTGLLSKRTSDELYVLSQHLPKL